jgi:hypothetical protein
MLMVSASQSLLYFLSALFQSAIYLVFLLYLFI